MTGWPNSKVRDKGRIGIPKRMDFRISSKGGGEVIFNQKFFIVEFGPLHRALNRT